MNFLFLVGIAIFCVTAIVLGLKWFGKDALYVLAFGLAIGSNVYNIGNYGFYIGDYLFGIDSIIYTMFVFCVILAYLKYGVATAKNLVISIMCSIMLTGLLQFVASWVSVGFSSGIVWGLVSFALSAIATGVAIWVALVLFKLFYDHKCPSVLNVFIFFVIVTLLNSIIYFGGVAVFNQLTFDLVNVLTASYIGKLFATLLCLGVYSIFYKKIPNAN